MFNIILQQLIQLFTPDHQTNLDRYISAHRPTCAADVERLEREYAKYVTGGLL